MGTNLDTEKLPHLRQRILFRASGPILPYKLASPGTRHAGPVGTGLIQNRKTNALDPDLRAGSSYAATLLRLLAAPSYTENTCVSCLCSSAFWISHSTCCDLIGVSDTSQELSELKNILS